MAASWSSGSSSSARGFEEMGDLVSSSPLPYRVGPLAYRPPVMCKCGKKAAQWISWSDKNPGRRYLKCYRAREGGCDFYEFVDTEGRTKFVNQLVMDLRDAVRTLRREKESLLAAAGAERIEQREMEAMRSQLEKMANQRRDMEAIRKQWPI